MLIYPLGFKVEILLQVKDNYTIFNLDYIQWLFEGKHHLFVSHIFLKQ